MGSDRRGQKYQVFQVLAMWSWGNYLTLLSLSFLIWKMEIIMLFYKDRSCWNRRGYWWWWWGCSVKTYGCFLSFPTFSPHYLLDHFSYFFIVVQVQLCPFSPHHSSHPTHPYSPPLNSPLWLCPYVLHTCSLMLLPHYSLLYLSLLPSDYCQIVLYFNVSGFVLLACLFCGLGEIIWYFSFTAWLVWLNCPCCREG